MDRQLAFLCLLQRRPPRNPRRPALAKLERARREKRHRRRGGRARATPRPPSGTAACTVSTRRGSIRGVRKPGVEFLRRVFNVALANDMVERNPVRKVRIFREGPGPVQFPTEDEETRLSRVVDDTHWPVMAFALHTGPSPGGAIRSPLDRHRLPQSRRHDRAEQARCDTARPPERHGAGHPPGCPEPTEEHLRLRERHWRDAARRAELLPPGVSAGPAPGPHRELPVARSPAHVRLAARHARRRHPQRAGADGTQDAHHDAPLLAPVERTPDRRRAPTRRVTRGTNRQQTGTGRRPRPTA